MLHVPHRPVPIPGSRRTTGLVAILLCAGLGCTGTIGAPGDSTGGEPPTTGGPPAPTDNPPVDTPAPRGCGYAPRRIWALTPHQYGRTVAALLPGELDAGARIASSVVEGSGFSNRSGAMVMTEPHVTEVLESAVQLAGNALAAPAALDPCLGQAAPDDACLEKFVGGFVGRAFRRELETAEIDRLVTFTRAQGKGDTKAGLRQLLLYVFASPEFLFRTELGPAASDGKTPVTLTGFEKASALSYFLTDGPPDAQLAAAARAGALDVEGLETHARRLLATAETAQGLTKLLHEQYQTDAVLNARKDPDAFAMWNDALAQDLSGEADRFIREVLWQEDARLETLLTANFSMLNASLATFYGAGDTGGAKDFHKVTFKPGERAGLVTQGAVMAAQALDNDTSPVRRGLYVREALLCQGVPDPPANVNAVPPEPDGKRQQRERLAMHSGDPTCAGCHTQMDPIGLGFETYDGIGRYRTVDVGRTLDTTGTLTGVATELPFENAVELLQGLARAPEVGRCFVQQAFAYGHGRGADPDDLDRCALGRLTKGFDTTGGNVVDLAVAIATEDSFFVRR